ETRPCPGRTSGSRRGRRYASFASRSVYHLLPFRAVTSVLVPLPVESPPHPAALFSDWLPSRSAARTTFSGFGAEIQPVLGPEALRFIAASTRRGDRGDRLHKTHVLLGQLEPVCFEVLAHMLDVRRSGQRKHAHLVREAEDDLRGGLPDAGGEAEKSGMLELPAVGGEQGKALVHDPLRAAEGTNCAVPPEAREAAVLDECRRDDRVRPQLLELVQSNVADSEESRSSGRLQLLHRPPHFTVARGETAAARGSVKNVRIDRIDLQMLERASEGLANLTGRNRARIVRQAVVLSAGVGELGLKEHLVAPYDSFGYGLLHRGADSGLEVVAPLVRRVNAPEARFESEAGQPLGLLLLPRCT